jgi:hypothetical protein
VRIPRLKKKKNTTPGIFTEPKERLMVEQTNKKEMIEKEMVNSQRRNSRVCPSSPLSSPEDF